MKELLIKIKILERVYPLKIDPADESILRQAGKELEMKIKRMKDMTGARDKQDLMAMVAFDLMVENLKSTRESTSITERIASINKLIDSDLQES